MRYKLNFKICALFISDELFLITFPKFDLRFCKNVLYLIDMNQNHILLKFGADTQYRISWIFFGG